MTETTLSVPEIHCDHCKHSIEGALRPLDGVEDAEVDIGARTVRVRFDEPATVDVLKGAIEDQGYEVEGAA